jgi:hypothetical protein
MSADTTALVAQAPQQMGHLIPARARIEEIQGFCGYLIDSGILPNYIDTPQKATVILLKGEEIGCTAMQAIEGLYPIDGKCGMTSHLMMALLRKNGIRVEVIYSNAKGAKMLFTRKWPDGFEERHVEEFVFAEAQQAGLTRKHNWAKWPKRMFRARTLGFGARHIAADVLGGNSYVMEELGIISGGDDLREVQEIREAAAAPAEAVTVDRVRVTGVEVSDDTDRVPTRAGTSDRAAKPEMTHGSDPVRQAAGAPADQARAQADQERDEVRREVRQGIIRQIASEPPQDASTQEGVQGRPAQGSPSREPENGESGPPRGSGSSRAGRRPSPGASYYEGGSGGTASDAQGRALRDAPSGRAESSPDERAPQEGQFPPAYDMDRDGDDLGGPTHPMEPQEIPEGMKRRIFALWRKTGRDDETRHRYLEATYGVTSLNDLTRQQADDFLSTLENRENESADWIEANLSGVSPADEPAEDDPDNPF